MTESPLLAELKELEGAEEFLDYFGIDYAPTVVQVNRLHILQRFHDYLNALGAAMPAAEDSQRAAYADCLRRAYQDFVTSDALTEKVFKVFQRQTGKHVAVFPLDRLVRR